MENERLVRDFCKAWEARSIPAILGFFADDAVYHNVPMEPLHGRAAIGQFLETFVTPVSDVVFEVRHVASSGPVVFTERVDRFVIDGKKVSLPVAGVFEIRDGKIAAWRDYFDLQTWLKQAS